MGLLAGVAVAPVEVVATGLWLLVAGAFLLIRLRRHDASVLALLVLVCFGVGQLRAADMLNKLSVYDELAGQKVVLIARAAEDGVYGERYQLVFKADTVQVVSPVRVPAPGSITIKGFGVPAANRGDIVRVSGKLYKTRGNAFAGISFARIEMLKPTESAFEEARRQFVAGMQTALPEPAASFGLGILIGQRSTMPEEYAHNLRVAGLTHIVAVSGYNLTIIVELCRRLLSRLSKFQNTALCVALICLFLFVTGSSPPIVRAAIISGIGLAAWYYGRTVKPMVLLLSGAAITIWANPAYLWGNVSWYLSFLAFYGVLVLAPLLTRRMFDERQPGLLTSIIIEGCCASVMTMPYILFIFGQASLVAILANLLVVPFIPFAMLASLVAGLAGMFVPLVAGWLAWPATMLLTYMLDIATLLARVPHAFVEHISLSLPAMLGIYAAIGTVAAILWARQRGNMV